MDGRCAGRPYGAVATEARAGGGGLLSAGGVTLTGQAEPSGAALQRTTISSTRSAGGTADQIQNTELQYLPGHAGRPRRHAVSGW